jgi:hypothetical protein
MSVKQYTILTALVIGAVIGGGVMTAWTESGYAQQAYTPPRYAQQAYTPPDEAARSPLATTATTVRAIQFVDEAGKVRCTLALAPNSSGQSQPRLLLTDEHGKVLSVLSGHGEIFPATR